MIDLNIPANVRTYCAAKGYKNPRIVEAGDCYRALATSPKGGVVLVSSEVYCEEIGDEPKFNNIPNQQITSTDGDTYWVSRRIAVVVIPIFDVKGAGLYVPLGMRSERMQLEPNKWGIPCGFLDWGESAREAVRREVWEELGIDLTGYGRIPDQPSLVISEPNPAENETVSFRFVVICDTDSLPVLRPQCDEVTDTKWIDIFKKDWEREALAFNHAEIIEWALNYD